MPQQPVPGSPWLGLSLPRVFQCVFEIGTLSPHTNIPEAIQGPGRAAQLDGADSCSDCNIFGT